MNNSHDFEAIGKMLVLWTESNNVVENSKAINAGTETNNNIGRHA